MGERNLKNTKTTNAKLERTKSIDCKIKLVISGQISVGKSALALRFVRGQFSQYHGSTIGAAFLTQIINVDDTAVKFEIWDTAGQEKFYSMMPFYYHGAQAAIVVYDITNQDSFVRAQMWVEEVQRQASPDIVIALAGNKADLADYRAVDYEEAKQYAEEKDFLFMETSAKTDENINEIFSEIAKKLSKKNSFDKEQIIRLTAVQAKPAAKGCCNSFSDF